MKYRFNALRVPDDAESVATYNSDGQLLGKGGSAVPQTIILEPDNSEENASVDLDAADYPEGSRVIIKDVNGATTNNITVTALGSFVDTSGDAVDQVVINADDGFAVLDIVNGLTVVSASKGVDLEA